MTELQKEVIRMYKEGLSIRRICEATAYSEQGVYSILRRNSVPQRTARRKSGQTAPPHITALAHWNGLLIAQAYRLAAINPDNVPITAAHYIKAGIKMRDLARVQALCPAPFEFNPFGNASLESKTSKITLSWLDVLKLIARPETFFREVRIC